MRHNQPQKALNPPKETIETEYMQLKHVANSFTWKQIHKQKYSIRKFPKSCLSFQFSGQQTQAGSLDKLVQVQLAKKIKQPKQCIFKG